jgi:1-acyl-sn-glycerol-3-phosphate acyltransferase
MNSLAKCAAPSWVGRLHSNPERVAPAIAPVSHGRAAWRLGWVLIHLLAGLCTIFFKFPRLTQTQKELRVQAWASQMLVCLGIRLVVKGTPAEQGPLLLVANHISWLDISALHAARYCRFVSKSDVKGWPVIGRLAAGVGTLFIERQSRRDTRRIVHNMAASLSAGDVLAVFPEGTTGDGVHLLPFHGNLLQAAISANVPIQPVALSFVDEHTGHNSQAASFVLEDTLLTSVWRTLGTPGIVVQVSFGGIQMAQGRDRRVWAANLHTAISQLRA